MIWIITILGCAFAAAVLAYFVEFRGHRHTRREVRRLEKELPMANDRFARKRESLEAEVRSVEEKRAELAAELARVQAALQEALNARSIDSMRSLFHGAVYSDLFSELLFFRLYKTNQEAADGLQHLLLALERAEGELAAPPAILWAQQTLATILDNPIPGRLSGPGQDLVYTKAMECYAAISDKIKEPKMVAEAVAQTKRCLENPRNRKEAVRNMLVPMLNAQPQNRDLLDLYDSLLHGDPQDTSREALEISQTTLFSMPTLSAVDANELMRFLESAFATARKNWAAFGERYSMVVTRFLGMKRFGPAHLQQILDRIHEYMEEQGPALFADDDRTKEYTELCQVIVVVHNAQGNRRLQRKKNRHVVLGPPEVAADLMLVGGMQRTVTGRVQNFAVGDQEWCGGAWIVSNDDGGWPPGEERAWPDATVTLRHAALAPSLTLSAMINGPYPEGKCYGFRVKWPEISIELAARLELLAKRYPITR
jgi:hypothetical protein